MSLSGLLNIGLSGLAAQSTSLEVVSNNIANSQTTGFRRARTDFAQLVASAQNLQNSLPGTGVSASSRQLFSEQGFIDRTQVNSNIAIAGNGFFVVTRESGDISTENPALFTRAGDFTLDTNGNLVNGAGLFLQGQVFSGTAPTGLNGLGVVNLANFNDPARATTEISISASFALGGAISPSAGTYNPANPQFNLASGNIQADISRSISVFDNNGNVSNLTLAFIRTGNNQVSAEIFDPQSGTNLPIASGNLIFANDGNLDETQSTLPTTFLAPGSNDAISFDFSQFNLDTGSTRITSITNDGNNAGTLTDINIDNSGILSATFSNGQNNSLFQIPLAIFTNNEGLLDTGPTAFQFDPAAGELNLTFAGQEGAGSVEGSAIETSTVDIGVEFSTLIQTQRAYAANARVISLADELYSTLNETAV